MSSGHLLRIRLYESDRNKWYSRAAYEDIVRRLWSSGAPGITVFHDIEGLDARGNLQIVDSDYASNVPITMEVYGTPEEIDHVYEKIVGDLPKTSRVFVMRDVVNVKGEMNVDIESMKQEQAADRKTGYVLRVYMKEEDQHHHLPLYHALLVELKKLDVLWVDVQHALEGFGADHVIRRTAWLSFSSQSPIVLEATLNADSARAILDEIQPLLDKASGPAMMFEGTILHMNVKE